MKKQIFFSLLVLFVLIGQIDSSCLLYAADLSQSVEMKTTKLGFFPHQNKRGLTSYFPEVSFKFQNVSKQAIMIKKVIVTYLHSSSEEIIYVQRIPLNEKINAGKYTTLIRSASSYGFSKKQLFNMLANQYDPTAIGGDTGDVGDSVVALVQIDEMAGTKMGYPIDIRDKWLREGFRVTGTNRPYGR